MRSVKVVGLPSRTIPSFTVEPTGSGRIRSRSTWAAATGAPFTDRMTSPASSTPRAGRPSIVVCTTTDVLTGILRDRSAALVACCWESVISWAFCSSTSCSSASGGYTSDSGTTA